MLTKQDDFQKLDIRNTAHSERENVPILYHFLSLESPTSESVMHFHHCVFPHNKMRHTQVEQWEFKLFKHPKNIWGLDVLRKNTNLGMVGN